jgi:hypothetical protein
LPSPLLTGSPIIVGLAAPGIAQDLVGLLKVQERLAALAGAVWVPSLGLPAICRFDLIQRGVVSDAKDQVVVLCHTRLTT